MQKRLAYLVGAQLKPSVRMDGDETPRAEYSVFAERNTVDIYDYSTLDIDRSRAVGVFRRLGYSNGALAVALMRVARRYSGVIVSGEDVGLPVQFLMRLCMGRTPLFIITHGSYFRSAKFRWLMRIARRFNNVHYLCLSASLRTALADRFGVPDDRAHNAGYGVDTEFFRPMAEPLERQIASAGTANRDYRTLVKASTDLPISVKIAADSAWFPCAVDIAQEALPTNVEARSYGNYRSLRDLYAASAFVVVPLYPSQHACGYAVIIEAMAMGKPVIATRTASYSDFILEGETGFYVDPGDADGLRARMEHLLARPEERRRMGLAARCLIENRYSLQAYCERIETVVQRVVNGEGA